MWKKQWLPQTGAPFLYTAPEIIINLAAGRLRLEYAGMTLLTSSIGQGSPKDPTPQGVFTVTDRIQSNPQGVNGSDILSLNHTTYAIHGTNQPNRIGRHLSLGCIEIPNTVAAKLYRLVPVGTQVVIHQDDSATPPNPTTFR